MDNKIKMGPKTWIYPMHALLIGANVYDKPNFMTMAWGGIACAKPPMIAATVAARRYTAIGIKQNMTFSVNIPSIDQVKETDYCGLVSGSESSKAEACEFNVFYGNLGSAPLIEQCPLNMECKVVHILELGTMLLVIGEIVETYISEKCLTRGKPDVSKIRPIVFTEPFPHQYHALGEVIAEAFSVGRDIHRKRKGEE